MRLELKEDRTAHLETFSEVTILLADSGGCVKIKPSQIKPDANFEELSG